MADTAITAANVLKSASANPQQGTFGASVAQGQVVTKNANGLLVLADSNGTPPLNSVVGLALNAGGNGQPGSYQDKDLAFNTGATTPLTPGTVMYLSDTPGAMTPLYSDIASGSTVIALGIVNTDGTLNLSPIVGGTK